MPGVTHVSPPKVTGFLIRVPAGAAPNFAAASLSLKVSGTQVTFEPLYPNEPGGVGLAAAGGNHRWFLARTGKAFAQAHPWDLVHQELAGRGAELGLGAGSDALFIEPDLEQQFPAFPPSGDDFAADSQRGRVDPQDPDFPFGPGFAWFLNESYSQLGLARAGAGASNRPVRIAHLDTGYDPLHQTVPQNLLKEFGYDFVENRHSAHDPGPGGFLKNPGHGTGTLGILAGNKVAELNDDFLGGAPLAEIVPIRIATSVILLRTSALARGIQHALSPRNAAGERLSAVDVISLSMGGVASQAWAEAVNAAYEAGVTMVAAAGNNFSAGFFGFPTRFVVYPARFRRVIAACGVMANRKPYFGLRPGKMQGNFGPDSKMATAMAAFTPNMPWPEMGAPKVVDMNGQGTSSATPQIAAAAALWIQKHRDRLDQFPEPWMRVEAVRAALFNSADKSADGGNDEKLGNGILQAFQAMEIAPSSNPSFTPPDSASFSLLRVLTGLGMQKESAQSRMFSLEATQLTQQWEALDTANPFEQIGIDPDLPSENIPADKKKKFLELLMEHPRASKALRRHLSSLSKEIKGGPVGWAGAPRIRQKTGTAQPSTPRGLARLPVPIPKPVYRRLRGYAFDPGLTVQLNTAPISTMTFKVPWEDLAPGPVGEYLEVVDFDPASKCLYEPVNLNDPHLLAQDGFEPSEGRPQFHQQMVYAVASLTIRNFEEALGRKALWAPGPSPDPRTPKNDSNYVQRLRIYPHALRDANAYYSPSKKALLFGYYQASGDDPAHHMPGGMVFTCLSHDVIAHETTHALLDGLHRRFILPTNPDMRAFHEAFADLVALFQHFTYREILRDQIASTRGDIRNQENLLAQLASQFGRTTGMRGALRDYIGKYDPVTGRWEPHKPTPQEYEQTEEAHLRGAILVSAVFDAFLSIYQRRTADLFRLATGGTGVLPMGAIHPDLVTRLSEEASKAASHVLAMCIRALDYFPPLDLTFGEYLRGLITADYDLVRDDDLNYRVAFIEAFRKRGIYPRDVRVLSVESLVWRTPENDPDSPSKDFLQMTELRDFVQRHLHATSRREIFFLERQMRSKVHRWLKNHFGRGKVGEQDAVYLGIDGKRSFEVHSARLLNRIGPDGNLLPQLIIEILQEKKWGDGVEAGGLPFVGGSTIIASVLGRQHLQVVYCIRKSVRSEARAQRQAEFAEKVRLDSLRSTYFGQNEAFASREPFALLHRQ